MVTESVWRGLTGGESVHLTDWPSADDLPADPELVTAMDRAREACSAAHSVRKANGLRARLPLAQLTVAGPDAAGLAPFRDLIAEEVNVKTVVLTDQLEGIGEPVLTVLPKVAGPRLGPDVQKVIKAVKAGDWSAEGDGTVVASGITLQPSEFELRLRAEDETTTRVLPGDRNVVVVDLEVTPELDAEGVARDIVRIVNDVRRKEDLKVTDRIRVMLNVPKNVEEAVRTHATFVTEETLADELSFHPHLTDSHRAELPDGRAVHIQIHRV
jgi:isoleucyl-tRNA synthetase